MARGFASFSPEKLKLCASKGGTRSQALNKGHRWDAKEASLAGQKGGKHRWKNIKK